jgi:hypothetical protein
MLRDDERSGLGFVENRSIPVLAAMVVVLGIAAGAAGQGTIETIALGGQPVPNQTGTLSGFEAPFLNNAGQVAFAGQVNDDRRALFVYDPDAPQSPEGSRLQQVARERQSVWDGELVFTSFDTPRLSAKDRLVFGALVRRYGRSPSGGLYLGAGPTPFSLGELVRHGQDHPLGDAAQSFDSFALRGLVGSEGQFTRMIFTATLHPIGSVIHNSGIYFMPNVVMHDGSFTLVREGQEAPGGGTFGYLFTQDAELNAGYLVAFNAPLRDTGATNNDSGIYTIDAQDRSDTLALVVREGQEAPGGGVFGDLDFPPIELNAAGQIAFTASLRSSGRTGDSGVFLASMGSEPEVVARAEQPAPDASGSTDGRFGLLDGRIRINDAGQVAFEAENLLGTSRGVSNDTGIFRGSADSVIPIAWEGQRVGILGEFSDMRGSNSIALNGAGVVAFFAYLRGTAGGDDDDEGLFLSDGRDLVVVAREGDALEGSTIASLGAGSLRPDGLNDLGQVAFTARLANGEEGVFLFTPTLGYRRLAGGRWDEPGNWTLGLAPDAVHDVILRPEKGFKLFGPGKTAVIKSLSIGVEGRDTTTLKLDAGSLVVREGLEIGPRGRLEVRGVLRVEGGARNTGEIANLGGVVTIRNGLLNEAGGTISGRGAFGLVAGPTSKESVSSEAPPRPRCCCTPGPSSPHGRDRTGQHPETTGAKPLTEGRSR